MKSNEKTKKISKAFLSVFDATELTGRKKNLIRAGDAFCYIIKEVLYTSSTFDEVATLFNTEFKKNKKFYLHSDVIMAIRRHNDRVSSDYSYDAYYTEAFIKTYERLREQNIFNPFTYEKEQEEGRVIV